MLFRRFCLTAALALLAACAQAPMHRAAPPESVAASTPPPRMAAPKATPTVTPVPTPATPVVASAASIAAAAPPPHEAIRPASVPAPARRSASRPETHSAIVKSETASARHRAEPASEPSPVPARTVHLRGRLTLTAGRGQILTAGELVDSVVYYVPASGAPRPQVGRFDVYTINRDFKPAAIAVPLGSTVRFDNQDEVRHNVFSVTPGSAFNLGYQAPGQSVDHPFTRAGVVLVSCNVHRSMESDVLVVPSAYVAKVAADGAFMLRGLPPGPGQLYYWNPRAPLARQSVTVPTAAPINLTLVAGRPRVSTEIDVGASR